MGSGVEEEGTCQGTTMYGAIAHQCSDVEQWVDAKDSLSGVEEPAGAEGPISGVEEAAGGNHATIGDEEIGRFRLLTRELTSSDVGVEEAAGGNDATMQYSSCVKEPARSGKSWYFDAYVTACDDCCFFQCVMRDTVSPGVYWQATNLKELKAAVENWSSNRVPSARGMQIDFGNGSAWDGPKFGVTEELIEFLLRIDKHPNLFNGAGQFLLRAFLMSWTCVQPNIVKLAVGTVMSSAVCPKSQLVKKAVIDSAFMSCHTMPEVLKLLLEFNPDFGSYLLNVDWLSSNNWIGERSVWVMMQEYMPSFLPILSKFKGDMVHLGVPGFQCYSETTKSKCTLQNVMDQWILNASVIGLKSPWSSKDSNQKSQNIELEVLMKPSTSVVNSLTLKISNLKFHNVGQDTSSKISSQFFLSEVVLTATPEVEPQHFVSTKVGCGSANRAYDRMRQTTLEGNASLQAGNSGPMLGLSSTQTRSLTSKNVTDWKYEQKTGTQNCHNSKSGTVLLTLENLGGLPFDKDKPCYPKNIKKSDLPWNTDGSVAFTDKEYPDTITWSFKPELQGMVVWRISMEVSVTILKKSQTGETLKFCFAGHLEQKH